MFAAAVDLKESVTPMRCESGWKEYNVGQKSGFLFTPQNRDRRGAAEANWHRYLMTFLWIQTA